MRRSRLIAGLGLAAIIVLAPQRGGATVTLYDGDYGHLNVAGFLRAQYGVRTSPLNPNNAGLQEEKNDLNQARHWLVLDTRYDAPMERWFGEDTGSLRLFSRMRAVYEGARDIDKNVAHFDAFPTDFHGDGSMMRAAGEESEVEIWELYLDYENSNVFLDGDGLWVRAGRQTVVWGEAEFIRLLDVVNSLDLSWHLLNENALEVLDHIRIPLWMLRVGWNPPWLPDWTIEGILSPGDFVGTQLPAPGSPYNVIGLPPFIQITEDDIDGARGKVTWGGRILGEAKGVTFTVNFIQKPLDDGLFVQTDFVEDATSPIGGKIIAKFVHPTINIVGGSWNYFEEVTSTVFRGEAIWIPDQHFESSTDSTKTVERNEYAFVVGFDRPTQIFRHVIFPFVYPTPRSTFLTLQFLQRFVDEGGFYVNGAKGDKDYSQISFLVRQPMWFDQAFLDFTILYDFDDGGFVQPAFTLAPGDHWRFGVWYNGYFGSETRPGRVGALKDVAQEVMFAITRQF